MLMYPVATCIAIPGLFSCLLGNDRVWKGMAVVTVLIGSHDAPRLVR